MPLPPPECKVYTPPELASAMVRALNPSRDQTWLDPCIGPGAFVRSLRDSGVPKEQIFGIDIDPMVGAEDHSARTMRGVDFFAWSGSTQQRFARIVANPPFVAIRKLHPKLQRNLRRFDPKEASFALRSNYWCAFLSASIKLLMRGGELAFVLPAAWEYALYARVIRERVNRSFGVVEIHRSLRPLFPQVQEGCVVLIAKEFQGHPAKNVTYVHSDSDGLLKALRNRKQKRISMPSLRKSRNIASTTFSELFEVRIGCVTGDASYFLLTEQQRVEKRLPFSAVYPVVSKARHLAGPRVELADWIRLRKANDRIWMFSPDRLAMRSQATQAYIALGKEQCDLDRYKLRNRDPWYRVPDIRLDAIGFMSGMTKVGPWICFRSMRGLAATNTLYAVYEKSQMTARVRTAWALSLLSSPVREQFHKIARRYADGLPKLEPHDICSLRLPNPPDLEDSIAAYKLAIEALLEGREDEAVEIADAALGID